MVLFFSVLLEFGALDLVLSLPLLKLRQVEIWRLILSLRYYGTFSTE